jgi:hypothetical protein
MVPEQRLFVWDSVAAQKEHTWTNDEREALEEFMCRRLADGETNDYILAVREMTAAPWPAYDKLQAVGDIAEAEIAEQILARVEDLEIEPQRVIDYELENGKRKAVLDAMRKRQEELDKVTEIIVNA